MKINVKEEGDMKKSPVTEGVKQFGRVVVVAAVPVLVLALESGMNWKATLTALAIAVLMAVDKYLHVNENVEVKGLVPF